MCWSKSGFDTNAPYAISVETLESKGVGHVVIASAGAFQQDPWRPSAASTKYSERHVLKSWQWMSPNESNSSSFFAVCATGYGGRAYVADALTVFKSGLSQQVCNPNNATAVTADCHCFGSGTGPSEPTAVDICTSGTCCWEDFRCRECSRLVPGSWLPTLTVLHCLLTSLGTALQLLVQVAESAHQRRRLILASGFAQCLGSCFILGPLAGGSTGLAVAWHVILGSLALGCCIFLMMWSWLRDDTQSAFVALQSGASLTLGWIAAGIGCVTDRITRPWSVGLVLGIFGLSLLYVAAAWNRKRAQPGVEHGQRIEIPRSDSQSSRLSRLPSEERVGSIHSSAMPLHPQGK